MGVVRHRGQMVRGEKARERSSRVYFVGLRKVPRVGRVREMVVESLSFGFGFTFCVFIRVVLRVHFGYVFMKINEVMGIILADIRVHLFEEAHESLTT